MRSYATVALFVFAFAASSVLTSNSAPVRADATPPQRALIQDELVKKVEDLTKRVEQLESDKVTLELKNKTQADLLGEIYSWMKVVSTACQNLDASVKSARENGFEKAGPNPRSKKALLSGLENFTSALRGANPAAPKPKAGKK